MVFDLNGWHDKAKFSDDPIERRTYFQLWRKTIEDMKNEHKKFKEIYQSSSYKCSINKQYLNQILPDLLKGDIFIPPALRIYMLNEYMNNKQIKELNNIYNKNGMNRRLGCCLKRVESGYTDEGFLHNQELLMFEVWEFTLTYPEFKELFVEEWN